MQERPLRRAAARRRGRERQPQGSPTAAPRRHEQALRAGILGGIVLLLLTPLVVTPGTIFPFVVGKAIWSRSVIEVVFALWVLLAVTTPSYRPPRSWLLLLLAAGLGGAFVGRLLRGELSAQRLVHVRADAGRPGSRALVRVRAGGGIGAAYRSRAARSAHRQSGRRLGGRLPGRRPPLAGARAVLRRAAGGAACASGRAARQPDLPRRLPARQPAGRRGVRRARLPAGRRAGGAPRTRAPPAACPVDGRPLDGRRAVGGGRRASLRGADPRRLGRGVRGPVRRRRRAHRRRRVRSARARAPDRGGPAGRARRGDGRARHPIRRSRPHVHAGARQRGGSLRHPCPPAASDRAEPPGRLGDRPGRVPGAPAAGLGTAELRDRLRPLRVRVRHRRRAPRPGPRQAHRGRRDHRRRGPGRLSGAVVVDVPGPLARRPTPATARASAGGVRRRRAGGRLGAEPVPVRHHRGLAADHRAARLRGGAGTGRVPRRRRPAAAGAAGARLVGAVAAHGRAGWHSVRRRWRWRRPASR